MIEPASIPSDPTGLKRELQGPIDTVTNTGVALTEASKQLNAAAKRVEDYPQRRRPAGHQQHPPRRRPIVESHPAKLFGNEENQTKLADALGKLPDTLDNMNRTFAATDEALAEVHRADPAPTAKTPIERMVETIEMTQRTLRQVQRADPSPANCRPSTRSRRRWRTSAKSPTRCARSCRRIDKGEGSLGALLNDRELYNRLNKAARNIEQVSRELRPIVEDAGVLMDKAARHPGGILRDAVKPGVGIK